MWLLMGAFLVGNALVALMEQVCSCPTADNRAMAAILANERAYRASLACCAAIG
jgi:hypothetical protein